MPGKRAYAINSLLTATVALFCTQVLHESIHFFAARLLSAEVLAFNLFGVKILLFHETGYLWKNFIIEGGASIVNVLVGFLALLAFHFLKQVPPLMGQFFFHTAGYNLLMGFGYFLFDALFYQEGAVGDWKSILYMLEGSLLLRLILIILGTGGMLFTFFWLARSVLSFSKDRKTLEGRKEVSFPLLLLPYGILGLFYLLLSLWHPLPWPQGTLIVFLQFFFGFSGFMWAFFLSVYWLTPTKGESLFVLPLGISKPWMITALLLLLIQVGLFLPTIYF